MINCRHYFVDESEEDLLAKRLIDEQYTSTPFYGSIEDEGMPAEAGAGHQPQAGNEADAGDGNPGDLSKAQAEHIGQWAQDLPVSFRGLTHRPA